MAIHVTREEAYKRAVAALGRMGLPQPWCPFGKRALDQEEGNTNDCCFFCTWILKDNGGRARSDYRNGSIKAMRADRHWPEFTLDVKKPRMGDFILLRWSNDGLPDHIGFLTSHNGDYESFNTIEANTGPKVGVHIPCGVYRRTRFPQNVFGFIRPPYLTESESK
jgi:hypothetical protein